MTMSSQALLSGRGLAGLRCLPQRLPRRHLAAPSARSRCLVSRVRAQGSNAAPQQPRQSRLRVLSAISRAVEIQGLTAKFESIAGRSAMLGTTTALVIEGFTADGLFHGGGNELLLAGGVSVVLLSAVLAALQNSSPVDLPLLEPVMASLTSTKRSGAAVTQAQVDSVLDDVMRTTFTASIMSSLVVDAIIDDSQLL